MYWWDDRVFEGVARFASAHGWVLDCHMRWLQDGGRLESWRGDGIIANAGLSRPLQPLLSLMGSGRRPCVNLQAFRPAAGGPRVHVDHEGIGRLGARHLLDLDLPTLAWVLFDENPMERTRCDAFMREARARGARVEELRWTDLRRKLSSLPRPLGLMAANDVNAIAVTTACLEAGLRVPEDVAVLGVDDSRIVCDLAEVPLSSVNCDFERQGFEAARLLQRLMDKGRVPARPLVIEPKGVTQRASTDTFVIPDERAVRALRLLRSRYAEPLALPELARVSGCPARTLQALFRKHLGRSPAQELCRLRVAAAAQALRDPRAKLDSIAVECGFSSRFHLVRSFRRLRGLTPGEYRRTLRD